MLSRVADAVFWTARYIERTDNILRTLRTNYIASQDEILNFDWRPWAELHGPYPEAKTVRIDSYHDAINYLVLSRQHDSSVFSYIVRARENARSVQDLITKELWQGLNDYYHRIRDPNTEQLLRQDDPVTALDALLRESTLFYGTVDTTMSRGEGYTFLNLGKYIERALQCLGILNTRLGLPSGMNDATQWKYLLYALSGFEFHGKFYRNSLQTQDVIHQVLFNSQFPHSVIYSLQQAERYFKRLEPISQPDHFRDIEFTIGKAVTDLKYSAVNNHQPEELKDLLTRSKALINSAGQQLAIFYFGYS